MICVKGGVGAARVCFGSPGSGLLLCGFLRLGRGGGGGGRCRHGFEEVGGFLGEAGEGVIGDLEGAFLHERVDGRFFVGGGDGDEDRAGGDGFEFGGDGLGGLGGFAGGIRFDEVGGGAEGGEAGFGVGDRRLDLFFLRLAAEGDLEGFFVEGLDLEEALVGFGGDGVGVGGVGGFGEAEVGEGVERRREGVGFQFLAGGGGR